MSLRVVVNHEERTVASAPLTPLSTVLREEFALTGTKEVCGEGFCGACTVLVDGAPAVSCLVPVGLVEGRRVETVESLAVGEDLSALQAAMIETDAVQCGMCFPGILMTLTGFFSERPDADEEEIRSALAGNICRCTGYEAIVEAALSIRGAGAAASAVEAAS
ncbi:(2Fe-2S)-binding protein [Amorphus orientalis]|uniref:Carbon-monoxide dehydrogenase small subunit n=1 Tax=Amorphus orientalis TaxID=649198 RepID=A0AAE3VNY7_9HYPH|nr:(2Fe-2S)-binding protein [Amorphus orientalis]MDQ0315427.1 carbon-monoxide dehydrogenase small subunit [Amorphus orientalis]